MGSLGPQGAVYNYVVTAQKSTNVTCSAVGNFTSPEDINLLISCAYWLSTAARLSYPPICGSLSSPCCRKCTHIEIHTLTAEGLQVSPLTGLSFEVDATFDDLADLQGVIDVPIYGRVATLELFRPKVKHQCFIKTALGFV